MNQKITEIFTANPISVPPETPLQDCIRLMQSERISCLLITENLKPVGIYTEKDMVHTLCAHVDLEQTLISELMSAPVITSGTDITIFEATYILRTQHIRHLIITDADGNAAGVVTQTDIIKHHGTDYFVGEKEVNAVMTKNILIAGKDQSVGEAVARMDALNAGCVVVVEEDIPVGILTERDMTALLLKGGTVDSLKIAEVMSHPVKTVQQEITTYRAAELMNRLKIRRLVVVNEHQHITGLLVQDNIVKELERNYIGFLKTVLHERERHLHLTKVALVEKSLHLENILSSSIDMAIVATDLDFRITYFNPVAEQIYDKKVETVIGQIASEIFLKEEIVSSGFEGIKKRISSGGAYTLAYSLKKKGKESFIEARITDIKDQKGCRIGYTLMARDVSESRRADEKLLLAARVFESAIEGIMVTDAEGNIQSVNPAFTTITGYTEVEVIGKNPRLLQSNRHRPAFYRKMWKSILDEGSWQGEIWNRRKNGETYPERLTISSIKDAEGKVTQYTAVFYDISDIKATEAQIIHRAYHDPLTELPNRLLFQDRLTQAIAHAHRKGTELAIMFLDIDHFKNLNDSFGHYRGDLFLKEIARLFKGCMREDDTVSRFGGDEFTVLMNEINRKEDAVIVARKLLSLFKQPFKIAGNELYLGASIGISRYPADGRDADTLIRNADTAMYHAKAAGRNNVQFFKNEMAKRVEKRVKLETDLRKALEAEDFCLRYQPIIDLQENKIDSLEVLIRWNRQGEIIFPGQFIPLAEECGLIVPIGAWVLRTACRQAAAWKKKGMSLPISVNLSGLQFRKTGLVETVSTVLEEAALPPEYLCLEITETVMMDDMERSIETLHQLKAMGVRISMDDFGTGYSSFTYLKRFPIDYLKLDHTFMRDIVDDADSARLAAGMISLAKGLRLQVIAEGVESPEQLAFLKEQGCEKIQGFLFYKPLSEEEVSALFLGSGEGRLSLSTDQS